MKSHRILYFLAALAATVVLLPSCTSDRYYAQSFLRKHKHNKPSATEQIYVCLPHEVLHTNSSLNAIEDFAYLSATQQDSVIASLTRILNNVDDSIFLDQFCSSLLYTLSCTRIPIVLVENPQQLPAASNQALIFKIPQLEAEEFVEHTRSDFYTRKGVYYAYDYDLRHFSTNVWLQFGADTAVYFNNMEVSDYFRGTVTSIRNQKATMEGNFDRININDAYYTARRLGTLCATHYIERVLTDYVKQKKGANEWYFYYDFIDNNINGMVPFKEGMAESFEGVTSKQ